ncbi:hypothetical protein [Nocardioides currus]|uniref:Htaa domain-containing protein n=1 Tax=Nocardioides currus TaxID=2133958 RepID=A0A2R7Z2M3_9ACTN|nr:hypothetical protein [Nocardioides currus]PUA82824.1 hypothetical protein C7S10_03690 [Nocardioides currus]
MKLISRLVALAVTATAVVASASPALAVGESTVSTTTAYVGDNCIDQPVNYSVALPADVKNWALKIKAIYPDGVTEGVGQIVGTFEGSPLTGTTTVQICGRVEPKGTWTLVPTITSWTDAAGKSYYDIPGTPSTFQVVGQAKSSASLKAKTKGKKVTATSKLVVTTDGTSAPIAGQPVAFQKKAGKKWKTIKSVTTSSSGTAKVKFKVKRKTTIRAYFAGAGEILVGGSGPAIPAATSKTVKVG